MARYHRLNVMEREELSRLLAAVQRIDNEVDRIRQNSEKIKKYIVKMMTEKEVREILGPPIREDGMFKDWFYGELWLCFSEPCARGDRRVQGRAMVREIEMCLY